MLLPLFHLSVVIINIYSIWYDQQYVNVPLPKEFLQLPLKGRLVFLTIWCLIFHTVYFGVALLNDIFGTNDPTPKKSWLRQIKDTYFSIAFALGVYGPIGFWGLWFIDKNLVLSDEARRILPDWLNHVMHTFVGVFIIIELVLSNVTYPSRKVGSRLLSVFVLSYVTWVLVLHQQTGAWPYPMLETMSAFQLLCHILSVLVVVNLCYLVGEKINRFSTKKNTSQTKSKKQARKVK